MIKNLKITVLILCLTAFQGFSQAIGFMNATGEQQSMTMMVTPDSDANKVRYSAIKHKMYISNEYKDAKVDNIPEVFKLRYNMFKDEMEFIKNNETYYLKKDDGRIVNFINNDTKFIILKEGKDLGYYKILSDGEVQLLVKQSVDFKDAVPAKSSYQPAKKADFIRNDDVYHIRYSSNGRMVEVPTSKRKFYDLFSSMYSDVKGFVKSNKLDIKDEKDLLKVVAYFNSN